MRLRRRIWVEWRWETCTSLYIKRIRCERFGPRTHFKSRLIGPHDVDRPTRYMWSHETCMFIPFLRAASVVASRRNPSCYHYTFEQLIWLVNWKKYFLFTCIKHFFLYLRVILPKSTLQLLWFREASKRRLRRMECQIWTSQRKLFKNHDFV